MSELTMPFAEHGDIRPLLCSALPDWNGRKQAPFPVVGILTGEGIGAEVVGAASAKPISIPG